MAEEEDTEENGDDEEADRWYYDKDEDGDANNMEKLTS